MVLLHRRNNKQFGCRRQCTALLAGCLVIGGSIVTDLAGLNLGTLADAAGRTRSRHLTHSRHIRPSHLKHTAAKKAGVRKSVLGTKPSYLVAIKTTKIAAETAPAASENPAAREIPAAEDAPYTHDQVLAVVKQALGNDPRITVTVIDLPENKFIARLSGEVPTEEEKVEIASAVEALIPRVVEKVVFAVRLRPPAPQATPAPTTATWDLRVLHSDMNDLEGTAVTADDITKVDEITKAINNIYKGPGDGAREAAQQVRDQLLLYGTPATILKMKRDLVRLDALGPQVQLDVSAIQLAGKGAELQEQINTINTDLIRSRRIIKALHSNLQYWVSLKAAAGPLPDLSRPPNTAEPTHGDLITELSRIGFNTDASRGLSFAETTVLLSVLSADDRRNVFNHVEGFFRKKLDEAQQIGLLDNIPEQVKASPLRNLREVFGVPQIDEGGYADRRFKIAQRTLWIFLQTLGKYQGLATTIAGGNNIDARDEALGIPERLLAQADVMDRYHGNIGDAYSRDVQSAVIEPMIHAFSKKITARRGGRGSVALLGQTRLRVTSGLQTSLKPTLTSSVDVTQPTPLKLSDVKSLQEGATGVVSGLTGSQAFLLGALLAPQPRAFATVAPGIGVAVRPTVLPNAASARLQIIASFGVNATMPQQAEGSDNPQPPVMDAVQAHVVKTDADVDALDLVGLSSMAIDTRVPQGPVVVPILGRIPILGPMFQFPRGDAKVRYYSVILVNTVILPRAMDITRFFAANPINP